MRSSVTLIHATSDYRSLQWRVERRNINFVDAMIELINLHTPALASLDHPDRFQAQYKVSFELNAGMVHDLAIQTQKRLASGAADPKWCAYLAVDTDSRQVVGFCDFKGPPMKDGTVEISYSTFLEFQGHGYAGGMVKALIDIAFGESRVTQIIADTLPQRNASTSVLEKNGFRLVKEMDDASDGLVWRWGLEKSH